MGTEDKLCGCEKGNIRCDIGWTQLVEWEGNLQEIPTNGSKINKE